MMGHKSISTTQIYAKVTDRKVDEDMKRLKEQTKGRKINLYEEDEPETADIVKEDNRLLGRFILMFEAAFRSP